MIKTIQRIRLPEVGSGNYSRTTGNRIASDARIIGDARIMGDAIFISSKFFVDRKGVLRSNAGKTRPTLFLRWRCDATSGKLTSHWESGKAPDSCLHPYHYFVAKHNLLAI